MAASGQDVEFWIKRAKKDKMRFIVSVCDTFDWDDYPVYCKDEKEMEEKKKKYSGENMQRVNEVINVDEFKITKGVVSKKIRIPKSKNARVNEILDEMSDLSEILRNQMGPRNDDKMQNHIKRLKTLLR